MTDHFRMVVNGKVELIKTAHVDPTVSLLPARVII